MTGIPPDLLRLAFCLVFSYPGCAILKRLPDNNTLVKELFIMSVSLFYLLGVFSMWGGVRTLLISTLATYYITKKWPSSPFMPWANFLFVMAHLFTNHIANQIKEAGELYDPNVIDITGAQMVLCMKLSAFGWNVYDGTQPQGSLSDFQKMRAVKKHPSLLDFVTYAFFFPSVLTGPSFDYEEFRQWIDLSMFDVTANDPKRGRAVNRKIPRSGRVATLKALEGVLWIVVWVLVTSYFNLDYALSPKFTSELNFVLKMLYLYVLGFSYRLKYYGAWSISEGSCILAGIGFNGKTKSGKYKWDRVKNIDPWKFEFGQNTFTLLEAWNMNTNKWLKNYVYLRVTPKGKKPGFRSTLATFFTSAFWHGTRPGYYLTFVTGAFFQALGKIFRRNLRPIFLEADGVTPGPYKKYYDILTWVTVQLGFGYMVQPFMILEFGPSLRLWSTVYFCVHLFIALVILLFYGPYKRTVTGYLNSLRPKETTIKPADKLKMDAEKLRQLQHELRVLSSNEPSLGVPQPDFEDFDDDVKEAIAEFEALKNEIARDIDALRPKVDKEPLKNAKPQSKRQ